MKGFWTPYRKGLLIAFVGIGSPLFLFFGFLAVITQNADLPLWLFILVFVAGAITTPWFQAKSWSRNHPARCPECRKSVLYAAGGGGLRGIGLIWPERRCSECGADLTGGRGHGYGP